MKEKHGFLRDDGRRRRLIANDGSGTAGRCPTATPVTMPSLSSTKTVALFGGAMHVDVPASFIDVSPLREVPDHQEVYADAAATDACLIVELLNTPPDHDDSASLIPPVTSAAAYHFGQLAVDADALAATLRREASLPSADMPAMVASVATATRRRIGTPAPSVEASVATGTHAVAKFREAADAANTVEVTVACFRLPHVTTDLLVIFNDPLVIAPGSSSAAAGAREGQGGGGGERLRPQSARCA